MPPPDLEAPPPNRFFTIAAVWTVVGLVATAQHHMTWELSRGVDLPWTVSLRMQMPVAWAWALATPVIFRLARRFPLHRRVNLLVHAAAGCAFVFVLASGYVAYAARVLPPAVAQPLLDRSLQQFVAWFLTDGVLYVTVVSIGALGDHQRRLRERERLAADLATQLAQAELRALKAQLQPHFLFNALHTIGALVRTGEPQRAVRVVSRLGDLLRCVVDSAAAQEVPLAQELDLVAAWLEIEQARFGDRLQVSFDVAPAARSALVPHLLLQPLVENAIRHGLEPHPGPVHLTVTAQVGAAHLRIGVVDDGPGPVDRASLSGGVGLANTRARLARLYGAAAEFVAAPLPQGGFGATATLPLRVAAVEAP